MKRIGKEVAFLHTSAENSRNGEGSFLRLKDGSIMYAYTEYLGNDRADHASARISACFSCDDGESFGAPRVLIEKDGNAENIMSVSLVRLVDGGIGIIYLRKEKMADGGIVCMPVFRRSDDEGKSFGEPCFCTDKEGYYCVINDGVIVQKSGRILVPLAYHGLRFDAYGICTLDLGKKGGTVRFVYSDDSGKSWHDMPTKIRSEYDDVTGFAEPGVYEYENGELWMWCRTSYGFQYQSRSLDGGSTWSTPSPHLCFSSPDAPMRVKRVGKYTVAVFNPVPYNAFSDSREAWGSPKRTPLVCAVSDNDGRSFDMPGERSVNRELANFAECLYLLEDDRAESYCYPAITETKDGFLVAYYHSAGSEDCLNCTKITKILYSELE